MNGFTAGRRPTLLLLATAALLLLNGGGVAAQGFTSVSSAGGTAAVAAPDGAASAGVEAPAARLASLGSAEASVTGGSNAAPVVLGHGAGSSGAFEQADKVLVDKSDRRLYLLRGERVVAEYPVKLGLNPYGHKQQEGDFRTPEGRYTLSRRNPRSDFFLAIQVSYPNREDAAWAKENGRNPGGLIMIHGQPNVPKRPPEFYANRDWTDGCIALSNGDMVDVWLRTTVGIPIEIRP